MNRSTTHRGEADDATFHRNDSRVTGDRVGRRRRAALALVFYLAATLAIAVPLPFHATETIARAVRPDTWLNLWALSWTTEHLLSGRSELFDANIFFPRSNTLAYTDHFIGQALLVAPVYWVTGSGVLAYNLAWYLAFALTAWGGYLWVRRVLGDAPGAEGAALVAGAICLLIPGKGTAFSHLQVISLQGVTLSLYAFHGLLSRPALGSTLGLAAAATWAALCSWYTAAYTALLLPALGLASLSVPGLVTARRKVAGLGALALLIATLIVTPIASPYRELQQELSIRRPIEELVETSLRPVDYVASWSWLHAPLLPDGSGAGGYFPGFVATALALIGIAVALRRGERWPLIYAAMGSFFALLSLGPRLEIGTASVPLPYGLLYEYVPGFTGLRNPYRAAFIAALLFALPAGRGALWVIGRCRDRLLARERWRTRPRLQRLGAVTWVAAGLLTAVHLLEAWPGPQEVTPLPERPPAWAWLAARGDADPAFAWPLPLPIDENARYQTWTIGGWRPLANGHSGYHPPELAALYDLDHDFPDPRFLGAVKEWYPVGMIVAHYGGVPDGAARRQAAAGVEGLRAIREEGDVVVYALDNGSPAGWLRRRLPGALVTGDLSVVVSAAGAGCVLRILLDGRTLADLQVPAEPEPTIEPGADPEMQLDASLDTAEPGPFAWLELMLVNDRADLPVALAATAGVEAGVAQVSINGWPLARGSVAAAVYDGATGRPKLWDSTSAEATSAAILLRRLLREAVPGDYLAFAAAEGNDPNVVERSRLLLDAAGGTIVEERTGEVARAIAFVGAVGSNPGTAREALDDFEASLPPEPAAPACRSASIIRFAFR